MAKLTSINPVNGRELGSVKIATKAGIEVAVERARGGFEKWREVSLMRRSKMMLRLASLLKKNTDGLGRMISKEMGKPLSAGISEAEGGVETVKYFAKEAVKILRDEVVEPELSQTRLNRMERLGVEDAVGYLLRKRIRVVSVIRYDPVGVVAAIKPWNYPIESVLASIVPALMAGNVVILKPSEYVPLVSYQLVKLFWQAGVPRDVLQVLNGRGQVGAMLVDAEVDMVSFTGSTEVGKEIADKCSKRLIKYVLELGGSSPALVLEDADLDLAVNGILWQRFNNCGQICAAVKRVFVEEAVADKFIEKIVEKVKLLKVGNPMEKETDVGPLVSLKQLKKLENQITRGVIQGGRILAGGRRMREEEYIKGFFHEPTLMVHVTSKMEIMQEETFGPVLPVCMVDDFSQAIKYANQSRYGLTAVVFTKSKRKARRAMKELEAGAVCVNEVGAWNVRACWSGLKESGVGVELGKHGIWEYTDKKQMKVNFSKGKTRRDWWEVKKPVIEETVGGL